MRHPCPTTGLGRYNPEGTFDVGLHHWGALGPPAHHGHTARARCGSTRQTPPNGVRSWRWGQAAMGRTPCPAAHSAGAAARLWPLSGLFWGLSHLQPDLLTKTSRQPNSPCAKITIPNLQVLRAVLVPIHVDSGDEDGLHLVVPQLVGGQVRGNEHLREERQLGARDAGMGIGRGTARRSLTCRALSATLECSVLLSCVSSWRMTTSSSVSVGSRPHSWSCNAPWLGSGPALRGGFIPSPTRAVGTRTEVLKWRRHWSLNQGQQHNITEGR